jgi:hypothetical protein
LGRVLGLLGVLKDFFTQQKQQQQIFLFFSFAFCTQFSRKTPANFKLLPQKCTTLGVFNLISEITLLFVLKIHFAL